MSVVLWAKLVWVSLRPAWTWVWFMPDTAVIARPAISPATATAATAAILRRMRRVITTSYGSARPAVSGRRWFAAAAEADGVLPPVHHHSSTPRLPPTCDTKTSFTKGGG